MFNPNYLLSRRELLKYLGASLFATTMGCARPIRPTPTPPRIETKPTIPVYRGVITPMEGKPLMSREKINQLTESLINSGNAFLSKIGRDVQLLTTAKSNPPEYPSWVNARSTPLPLTYDFSDTSWASKYLDWEKMSSSENFTIKTADRSFPIFKLNSLSMGTMIGSPLPLRAMGPLPESLLLAKEHITHMLGLRMGLEFYDYTHYPAYNLGQIVDSKNQVLTSRGRQLIAGASLYYQESNVEGNNYWKLTDGFPIFLVALAWGDLVSLGKLRNSPVPFRDFYNALISMKGNINLLNQIKQYTERWAQSDSLLPPEGAVYIITSDVIRPSIYNLYPPQSPSKR